MHLLLRQDAERLRVMADVLPTVEEQLATFPEVEACWQPSDFLPDFAGPTWREELDELRAEAERLEDDMLVVLVGNVVTEEALPSYQTALNRFGGMTDATGTERHAWACWSRAWTAEEKRHGDVTRAYLLLGGRVAMREVERTIQHLLRNGWISPEDQNLYHVGSSVEDAVQHVLRFYRRYHSSRYVRDVLVIRMTSRLTTAALEQLNREFADIVASGTIAQVGALPEENDHPELPRLCFHHTRRAHGRIRALIDRVNSHPIAD